MPTGYITILPFTLHIHHYIIHITIMTKVVAVTYEIRRVIDFLDDKALTCLHPSIVCRYGYNIGLLSYLAQIIWKFRTTSVKLVIIIIYVSVSSWWTLYWVAQHHKTNLQEALSRNRKLVQKLQGRSLYFRKLVRAVGPGAEGKLSSSSLLSLWYSLCAILIFFQTTNSDIFFFFLLSS